MAISCTALQCLCINNYVDMMVNLMGFMLGVLKSARVVPMPAA